MKIRDKLLLGFGFYILLAVVCGLFAYKDLRKIMVRLNLVEVADDITNTILEVRRYEKNYLLYRDNDSLLEFRKYLGLLQKNIDNIKAEISKEIGTEGLEVMQGAIAAYERLFDNIAENLTLQEELSEIVRKNGFAIEQELTGRKLQTFLSLRKHEKNLMLYKDATTYGVFMDVYKSMQADDNVDSYAVLVRKLFSLYQNEKNSVDMMRLKAREIQSFTENLSKRERAGVSAIIRNSMWMLLFALVAILVLGTVINIKLGMSISKPIKRLEKITKKIAQGDFSESIEVKGRDEISSLENSVNQMEEKLKGAMAALEETIEKLNEKQAELVKAEKLASIGKLAAGIAHEINNPLTSVLTFSSLLLEQCPPDDPRHDRLQKVVQETTRARNIVRQVLNFAREAPLRTEKMNVNRPVTEIIDSLISQDAFAGIELTQELSEDLPDIYIDPVQIGQVVLNILINAVHAIAPPGKIDVVTRRADGFIEILISDTGRGIPQDDLKKIFDPFYTTKDRTKGTGLGLAVSYGIIKKHAGDIEVSSVVGEGTLFTVRLPVNG